MDNSSDLTVEKHLDCVCPKIFFKDYNLQKLRNAKLFEIFNDTGTHTTGQLLSAAPLALSIDAGKTKNPGSIDIMITFLVVCFDWIVLAVFVM